MAGGQKTDYVTRELLRDALDALGVVYPTPGGGGGGGKWSSLTESVQTGAYTVVAGDAGAAIVGNSASPFTIALTAAATLGATFICLIRIIGAGAVTIDPNGAETINGAATISLAQGQAAIVSCTGSAFRALLLSEAFSPGSVGARITFNGTGTPAILDSFNISSITDNGVGQYTLNFTNPLPNTNYQLTAGAKGAAAQVVQVLEQYDIPVRTVSALKIYTLQANNAFAAIDAALVYAVIHTS